MLHNLLYRYPPIVSANDPVRFRTEPSIEPIDAAALLDLIPIYLDNRIKSGVGRATVKSYEIQLRPFVAWFEAHAPALDYQLTPDHLLDFADWLENTARTHRDQPFSHNSVAATFKRLRTFFNWCYRTKRADANLSSWLPTVTEVPKAERPLSSRHIIRLLQAADGGYKPERDRALVALLVGTGMRREECFETCVENIEFSEDKSGSIFLQVTKNGKPRIVVFGPTTGRLLYAHLDTLRRARGRIWDMTRCQSLWDVVNRLAQRADIGNVSLHRLRKTFSTHWYKEYPGTDGNGELFLKILMGHAPQGVTQRHYALMTSEDAQRFFVSPMETPLIAEFVDRLLSE